LREEANMSDSVSSSLFGKGKALVFGIIVLFLLTSSLSPVYAGFAFSKSNVVESKIDETTNVDIRNLLDRETFLDRFYSSELEKRHDGHPYSNRHYQYNQIRKPTVIDGVDGSWDIIVPDDYPTVQEAVYAADIGYRILVRSGTYKENVVIDVQSLTLHGEDRDTTFIDGSVNSNVIRVTNSADGANISEFTIQNSGNNYVGINLSSHYNILLDNIIKNNGHGISLFYSSGNHLQDNQIMNNDGDGIWLHRSSGNDIKENTLLENNGNGIAFTYSSFGTTVEDNTMSGNLNCGILFNESSLGNTVFSNIIENNDFGVKCIGVSDGNIFHHNNFIGNNQNAYDSSMDVWDYEGMGNYWDDYTGKDENNGGIGDTPYDIPGGENQDRYPLMNPAMITEKPLEQEAIKETNSYSRGEKPAMEDCSTNNQWDIVVPDDYPTIQEAVDHSDEGFLILVRPGVYSENVVINVRDLTLHGESKETTFIDGSGNDAHIVSITAPGVEVSGFTIRNSGSEYAGICIYAGSNTFQDNMITDCDFGIRLFGHDDNTVTGSILSGNKFGIVVWMSTGNQITNNNIDNNEEDGVVLLAKSTVELQENIIENNMFNGILMIGCSNANIVDSSLQWNGWFGIQMFRSNHNTIKKNDVRGNAYDGFSLHKSCDNNLLENTICNNSIKKDWGSDISFWYYSDNNIITKNRIGFCRKGIFIVSSNYNKLEVNLIMNTTRGIDLFLGANNNNIIENIFTNNSVGIEIDSISITHKNNNNIIGNEFTNHESAVHGSPSHHNNIIANKITNGELSFPEIASSDPDSRLGSCYNNISSNIINESADSYGLYLMGSYNIVTDNIITNHKNGMALEDRSNHNIISGNIIKNNNNAGIIYSPSLNLYRMLYNTLGSYNEFFYNEIAGNDIGIKLYDRFGSNNIYMNNFIDNYQHIYFENSFFNNWNANYWDDWTGDGPKIIYGNIRFRFTLHTWLYYTWLNFDWHPAKEPYDIRG
jgi:parallel beta-helix repeat protein